MTGGRMTGWQDDRMSGCQDDSVVNRGTKLVNCRTNSGNKWDYHLAISGTNQKKNLIIGSRGKQETRMMAQWRQKFWF